MGLLRRGTCSAGTWEEWRQDAALFPTSLRGRNYGNWKGEKFVEVRDPIVRDLMRQVRHAATAQLHQAHSQR
jgi:hypothetical protein